MCPAITKRFWILLVLLLFVPILLLGEGPPPEEQHFQKGLKYYLKGENKAAVSELNQSLQINPNHEQAQALLALISGKQKISPAPIEISALIKEEGEKLLSLELKNADLNDVLRLFAQEYGFNIVAGKEVAGTVTISLVNVPVEEALQAILTVNGFGYEKIGNLMIVSTLANLSAKKPATINALITKVFTLNYVSAEKIKEIVQKQLTPKIGTVDVMTNLYVGGWKMSGVSTSEKDLGQKEREKNTDEEKPKTLIVTDFPAVVSKIETIINQLDVKPSQILIEAMIVEIGSEYIRDIGINWDITKTKENYGFQTLPTAASPITPAFPVPAMGAGGGLSLGYDNSPLTVTINALEKEGKANILSNPRIMALDNYPAAIMVGERYPIITTTTTIGTGGAANTITGTLKNYEPIGISLRVIPHVNKEGAIEMVLHPEVTSLGANVTSGDQTLPRINSREADTNVTVKNGQTVVIGGLLTNETKDTSYKVPFLGDIPILGYLFKRTVKEPKKTELLIFITPHIVDESADASTLLQEKTAQIK